LDTADIIRRCVRILHIARKPTAQEFEMVAKVTAFGMVLFGIVGLILSIVLNMF
jgi:protein translocase SEC61 complex gamma subunit